MSFSESCYKQQIIFVPNSIRHYFFRTLCITGKLDRYLEISHAEYIRVKSSAISIYVLLEYGSEIVLHLLKSCQKSKNVEINGTSCSLTRFSPFKLRESGKFEPARPHSSGIVNLGSCNRTSQKITKIIRYNES